MLLEQQSEHEGSKECVDCLQTLPYSSFYKSRLNKGGLATCCKRCHRIRASLSVCKRREREGRPRPRSPEKRKDGKTYAQRRREKIYANPEKAKEYRRKRQESKRVHRAVKYGSGGRHSDKQWLALLGLCEGKCVKCGSIEDITRDHVVPLTLGGSDNIDNIQPLCRPCNSQKLNKHTEDYRSPVVKELVSGLGKKVCLACDTQFSYGLSEKQEYCTRKCYLKSYNKEKYKRLKVIKVAKQVGSETETQSTLDSGGRPCSDT